MFTFFISIVGGIGLIATLRYEMAVVPAKDDHESVNAAFLSLLIAFTLCSALAILIFLFNLFIFPLTSFNPVYKGWSYFLPAMIFMVSAGNVFQQWYNRKKEYRTLAVAKVVNSAGNNLLTLYLGFLGIGVWGLLLGNFVGLLVFNIFFVSGIYMRYRESLRHYDFPEQKSLARKHKDLPLANTPQILVELVQIYGIIFLLQAFFSAEIVGWYALSQRLLQAPLTLIGTSFAQVFYKDASERQLNDGNLTGLVIKMIKVSAMVAFLPLIVLLTIGPWLIGFVFGSAWHEAGIYARILAPWLFFDFIRATISYTPIVIGRTRTMFYISLAGAVLMVLQLVIGGLVFKNATTTLILLSGTLSLYSIGVILWILNAVKPAK
jgi:O-antigen/teichoic acid export membrane protein